MDDTSTPGATPEPKSPPPTPDQDQAGYAAPAAGSSPGTPPTAARPLGAALAPEERSWYLRPSVDIWLGPLLIVVCLVLRFGWNGIEGPPFPFWSLAYVAGAAGIYLTYVGWTERKQR
jgi:hypothetical protein